MPSRGTPSYLRAETQNGLWNIATGVNPWKNISIKFKPQRGDRKAGEIALQSNLPSTFEGYFLWSICFEW